MTPNIYFIPTEHTGRLAQMPRPRAGDWLYDELKEIKALGIDRLVSLIQPSEERELGLDNEATLFEELGGEFTRHPILDMSLPPKLREFIKLSAELAQNVIDGRGVAIHCRAGIGRSGMLTCAVLAHLGMSVEDALEHITYFRRVRVPDTDEQESWLHENLKSIQTK